AVTSLGARRRGPRALGVGDLAPHLLALPALLWLLVNVSVWTAGALDGRGIGHRAWASTLSRFSPVLNELVGRSGVPVLVLGILFLGSALVVHGRRAWAYAGAAVAASVVLGIGVGAVWLQLVPVS